MIKSKYLARLYRRRRWKPFIDMNYDPGGTNSNAVLYYDPTSHSRFQEEYIAGLDVIDNPIYYDGLRHV